MAAVVLRACGVMLILIAPIRAETSLAGAYGDVGELMPVGTLGFGFVLMA